MHHESFSGRSMYILMRGSVTIYILYASQDEDAGTQGATTTPAQRPGNGVRHQLGTVVTSLGETAAHDADSESDSVHDLLKKNNKLLRSRMHTHKHTHARDLLQWEIENSRYQF